MKYGRAFFILPVFAVLMVLLWAGVSAVRRPASGKVSGGTRRVRSAATDPVRSPGSAPGVAAVRLKNNYGQMPVYFLKNSGHLDSRVAYSVQGRDTSIYFEKTGVTFALREKARENKIKESGFRTASLPRDRDPGEAAKRWAVKLDFVGANPEVRITADQKTSAVISYFKGPPSTRRRPTDREVSDSKSAPTTEPGLSCSTPRWSSTPDSSAGATRNLHAASRWTVRATCT
ncbi:MAG: hypothetical protein ABI682_02850 [Acidobacteriota bacterium]